MNNNEFLIFCGGILVGGLIVYACTNNNLSPVVVQPNYGHYVMNNYNFYQIDIKIEYVEAVTVGENNTLNNLS